MTVDRIVQASLKLVLGPIFEADFKPVSLWLPPETPSSRCHRRDSLPRGTVPEIRLGVRGRYRGVLRRDQAHGPYGSGANVEVGDKRVLGLVKAFLRAGVLTREGYRREMITGTPQGGILSPLLANIALSVLDEPTQGSTRRASPSMSALHRGCSIKCACQWFTKRFAEATIALLVWRVSSPTAIRFPRRTSRSAFPLPFGPLCWAPVYCERSTDAFARPFG